MNLSGVISAIWTLLAVSSMEFFTAYGQGMGQFSALPWSLLWLNPSYTGFYGGLGNVGQLTPDSAYLFGAGGQIGVGGGRGGQNNYNYGLGAYNHAGSISSSTAIVFATSLLLVSCFWLRK